MKLTHRHLVFLAILFLAAPLRADDESGWVALFNGKDLSNWVNVNGSPETWTAHDGVIACTGKPTGALRTPRTYENFVLELEWRHLKPAGNAGVFVWGSAIAAPGVPFLRAIEVQVLDNAFNVQGKNEWYTTHGDLFPIHGALMKPISRGHGMRCFPTEERSKSSPEWNHYRIVGNEGKLRLSVNGKEVSGGDECVWRKGYLALESEGSPTEWRNLRIKELPSTGATPEQSAPEDEGWRCLYNGIDLRGWQASDEAKAKWTPSDWRLRSAAAAGVLRTADQWTDFELIVDVHPPKNAHKPTSAAAIELGAEGSSLKIPLVVRPGDWVRNQITVHDGEVKLTSKAGAKPAQRIPESVGARRSIGLAGSSTDAIEFGNIYIREMK